MPRIRLEGSPMMELVSIEKYSGDQLPSNLEMVKVVVKPTFGQHSGIEKTLIVSIYSVLEYEE